MDTNKKIMDKVEEAMQALDNLPAFQDNPHLYRQITNSLEARHQEKTRFFALRLSFSGLTWALVLFINIITFVYFFETYHEKQTEKQLINSLRQDFHLDQSDDAF
ncbi:MAG: hypothetical protein LWX56_05990 [Ignavibacteria bacterium]|nr:hypothetical protein [Ignavibacteria bacterium]